MHDLLIPGGKSAKMIKVTNPRISTEEISEICDKLKFMEPTPVVVLAGAMTNRA